MREGSTKLWELERAEARGGSKLNNIFSSYRLYNIIELYCQAQSRSPKVQSPKVKTKGTWADTIIT